MIKKSMVVMLAITAVAVMVVGIAAFGNASDINSSNQTLNYNLSSNNNQQTNISQTNTEQQTMISASEAQNIAQKYIQEPGATAGNPTLREADGQKVYTVPVILNGKTVGEIDIDALSGDNVGGAGGVS